MRYPQAVSFLDRLRRRTTTTATSAGDASPPRPEVTDSDLVEAAEQAVLPGFLSQAEAVERVRGVLELEDTDPRPEQAVEQVWARRTAEQSTWEGRSDHDRLTAAFRRLETQGFVTRMSFSCCLSCGTAEIDDERTAGDDAADYPYRETRYTFFHEQDAERLAETPATLFLAYSAWRPAPDTDPDVLAAARAGDDDAWTAVVAHTDAQVGRQVVEALQAEGLDATWDGRHTSRIAVAVPRWRKPLPA